MMKRLSLCLAACAYAAAAVHAAAPPAAAPAAPTRTYIPWLVGALDAPPGASWPRSATRAVARCGSIPYGQRRSRAPRRRWPRCGSPRTPPRRSRPPGRLGTRRRWATTSSGALSRRSASTACTPGPMKRSGGVRGRELHAHRRRQLRPHQHRDRPGLRHRGAVQGHGRGTRAAHGAVVIGDVIPGHSGKGADFRLAERGYGDYPGLYHMVEIQPADWSLLPPVPAGKDSINLEPAAVDALKAKRLHRRAAPAHHLLRAGRQGDRLVGHRRRASASTARSRRWVYLHYFKEGQPTLQLARSHLRRAAAGRRRRRPLARHAGRAACCGSTPTASSASRSAPSNGRAWSEGHPLSVTANQLIAGMVRKLGGFTFQELNLHARGHAQAMSQGGADLSYDFVTRPAYQHALVTGDAEFLRLMLGSAASLPGRPGRPHPRAAEPRRAHARAGAFLDPAQGHHVHLPRQADEGQHAARDHPRRDARPAAGPGGALQPQAANGVSCTTATVVAAALGIRDIAHLTEAQRRDIQRAHLLLALYNAMQPGVFALSGWDLVGALTLPGESVKTLARRRRHALDQSRRLRPARRKSRGATRSSAGSAARESALRFAAGAAQRPRLVRLAARATC